MRVLALFKRVLQQFRRDHRTFALLMMAPVLVLSLLWLVFSSDGYDPRIGLVDAPQPLRSALEDDGARLEDLDLQQATARLASHDIDAVIRWEGGQMKVIFEGSDPVETQAVRLLLFDVMKDAQEQSRARAGAPPGPKPPELSYLHGSSDMSSFDGFGPVLLGFLVFFFTFIISGVSFVRERTTGTLERMMASPMRRWEVVLGYAMAFTVVVLLQSTLVTVVAVKLLGMMLVGSFGWLLLVTLLLALTAMTLGMFVSSFAASEFQVFQFIPVIIIPQFFFSGIFHLGAMPDYLQALGKVLPVTYGAHAMRQVMIRGAGFPDIAVDLAVMALCIAVFMGLNVLALKRYRPI